MLGIDVLLALSPENLPRINHVAVDPAVVAFTAAASLVSAVIVGLVPGLRASRPHVMDLLRRAGRAGNLSSGSWLRNAVVVVEVTLAFVLLVGSGLMMRSFIALQQARPGYDPNGVLTFLIPNLPLPAVEARQAFVRDLKAKLDALPGVRAVTAASPLPLDPREGLTRWGTEEALVDPTKFGQATAHIVIPGYFEAMRTRLIEGRTFAEEDNRFGSRVVVIDRVLAAKAFPNQTAIGKTVLARLQTPDPERFQVIGVVEHQRHGSRPCSCRTGPWDMAQRIGGQCEPRAIPWRLRPRSAAPSARRIRAPASSTCNRCSPSSHGRRRRRNSRSS
jgi:putative ABC transport system permease protein